MSLSVRHYAGHTDKLLLGDDNNDIGDTGYTLMSKHLKLATVCKRLSAKGISTLAFMFQCVKCFRSASRCKLWKQHFNVGVCKPFPSCHLQYCVVLDSQNHFGRRC